MQNNVFVRERDVIARVLDWSVGANAVNSNLSVKHNGVKQESEVT